MKPKKKMDAYDKYEKKSVRFIMDKYGIDEDRAFGMFMLQEAVVSFVVAQALEDGLTTSPDDES